ncbi:MAG TPA: class I adenylate-forming enzyme family protein [Acidimicrobiia bacterium]
MTAIRASLDPALTGPGARFEIGVEDVLGEPMEVFVNRARSLRVLLERSARHGDAEYIVSGDRRVTYAQHLRAVASVAAALRERFGIGSGERVAILAANCPEWIVAFWATVSLGAVAVGMNGWWAGDEIRYGLADAEPKLLIADRRRLERLDGDPGVPVVEIDSEFDALWHHDPDAALPDVAIDEDDPALILYTSGTTGRPKGAVHSHRNVIALVDVNTYNGARRAAASSGTRPVRGRAYLTNPLFHVSGLHNGAIALLAQGATTVWHVGRFDPAVAMATMERERATSWSIVATTAWRVVNHPDAGRYDLSSLMHVGGGASPISGALQQRIREVFPNVAQRLGIGYGLTECTSLATIAGGGDLLANPDTVGRPVPMTELEIRDADGRVLAEGEEGEIHVRSPLVMLGYWRNPAATDAVILSGRWLRTGDIGSIRDGQLFLAARRTDLILRGGENVYPAEIENCLEAHPGVRECAVLGVPHDELGQEVAAIVVPAPGASVTGTELAEHVGRHLAAFKVPSRWTVRDEPLPRNATGKLLRHVVAGDAEATFVEE